MVVARDQLIVDAVVDWLDAEQDVACWGEVHLADATAAALERRPDVLLVGLDLTGDVISFVRRQHDTDSDRKVLILADHGQAVPAVWCLHAGASGVIDRSASLGLVRQSVLAVAAGATIVPPDLVPRILDALRASQLPADEWQERVLRLSARELEVLRWLMAGASRSVIASELILSINTIRTHVRNVLQKLEAHSSLEAIAIGRRAGLQPMIPRDPQAIDAAIPDRRRRPRDSAPDRP